MKSFLLRSAVILLGASQLWGCLIVRMTEHRIRLDKSGSGDALMRLIDIRSDGVTDSAVTADFHDMMGSYRDTTVKQFETSSRKITTRQFLLSGDTLIAELAYTFKDITGVEGLRATNEELYVVVAPEREVVKTNGKIETMKQGGVRIIWDRGADRLLYVIRERTMPSSISLGPMFRNEMRKQ